MESNWVFHLSHIPPGATRIDDDDDVWARKFSLKLNNNGLRSMFSWFLQNMFHCHLQGMFSCCLRGMFYCHLHVFLLSFSHVFLISSKHIFLLSLGYVSLPSSRHVFLLSSRHIFLLSSRHVFLLFNILALKMLHSFEWISTSQMMKYCCIKYGPFCKLFLSYQ